MIDDELKNEEALEELGDDAFKAEDDEFDVDAVVDVVEEDPLAVEPVVEEEYEDDLDLLNESTRDAIY